VLWQPAVIKQLASVAGAGRRAWEAEGMCSCI